MEAAALNRSNSSKIAGLWRDQIRSDTAGRNSSASDRRSASKRLNSALTGNNNNNTRSRNRASFHASQEVQQASNTPTLSTSEAISSSQLDGNLSSSLMHCGMVFVTAKARKWTFGCTFCRKITRDIGEFICHVRLKHLQGAPGDHEQGESMQNCFEMPPQMMPAFNSTVEQTESDYLDCSNYLDVNMQTGTDESNYTSNSILLPAPPTLVTSPKTRLSRIDRINNGRQETMDRYASPASIQSNGVEKKRNNHNMEQTTKDINFHSIEDDDKSLLDPIDDPVHTSIDSDAAKKNDTYFENMKTTKKKVGVKRRQIRGPAFCDICNKTFQYYSLYRNHMIKHSNETPFKCHVCQKGFKSKQAIRYHINTHKRDSNKQEYKCILCHQLFATESQHLAHVLHHEDANTFPCSVCGHIMDSEKTRSQHMLVHATERPFKCTFCMKRFRMRHHLSNHLKWHRQYKCDYCKAEFGSAVYLRKPYACRDCRRNASDDNSDGAIKIKEEPPSGGEQWQSANPMQLFDAVEPPKQPSECEDTAEMVTDSDGCAWEIDRDAAGADADDDTEIITDEIIRPKHTMDKQRNQYIAQQQKRSQQKNKHNNDDDDDDDESNNSYDWPDRSGAEDGDEDDDDNDNDNVYEDDDMENNVSYQKDTNPTKKEELKRLQCPSCDCSYGMASALKQHIRKKHRCH